MIAHETAYETWLERVLEEGARLLLCSMADLRASDDINMLDLGFSSLLLVRLQLQLRDRGATELSLSDVMDRSTLASLADFLADRYG